MCGIYCYKRCKNRLAIWLGALSENDLHMASLFQRLLHLNILRSFQTLRSFIFCSFQMLLGPIDSVRETSLKFEKV